MGIAIGFMFLPLAAALIFALPDKQGNSPRFLQFRAALVLAPPAIFVVLPLAWPSCFSR